MKNDCLRRTGPVGEFENPSLIERSNYQPTNYALAHEIRNPLTNINLAIAMLRSMSNIDDQKMLLDIISRASGKIEELIRNLLSPFRNSIVQSESHSIHKILDEVLLLTGDRIILKNIRVIKEYSEEDCEIVLNEPEMKIALTNIIVNAIEAITRPDGILKIVTKSNEDNFVIEIEDNGCGISKKDLRNIFKPYFTNKPGGLGLGLAATFDIFRSNHTAINVESAVNKGTCFKLTLEKKY